MYVPHFSENDQEEFLDWLLGSRERLITASLDLEELLESDATKPEDFKRSIANAETELSRIDMATEKLPAELHTMMVNMTGLQVNFLKRTLARAQDWLLNGPPLPEYLKSIKEALEDIDAAKRLDLYSRSIKKGIDDKLLALPETVSQLKNLEVLNMRGHRMKDLPKSLFSNCRSMDTLDISENCFEKVPKSIHKLPLERFYANNNKISELGPEIGKVENLLRLDLSHNEIEEIPNEIGQLQSLSDLDLSDNLLKTLPESMHRLHNLEMLNLRDNPLVKIPDQVFEKMKKLTYLDLSGTNLTELPISLGKLNGLKTLYLSNCKLQSIPENIAQLEHLEVLHISGVPAHIVPDAIRSLKIKELWFPGSDVTEEEELEPGVFNPASSCAYIIRQIEAFAEKHGGETFYAFAMDSGLLCFASLETFATCLKGYQKDYPEGFQRAKDIERLKFNTGDWHYQGFAESGTLDREDWPPDYDFGDFDRNTSNIKEFNQKIMDFLIMNQSKVFAAIRKTDDFRIFNANHSH